MKRRQALRVTERVRSGKDSRTRYSMRLARFVAIQPSCAATCDTGAPSGTTRRMAACCGAGSRLAGKSPINVMPESMYLARLTAIQSSRRNGIIRLRHTQRVGLCLARLTAIQPSLAARGTALRASQNAVRFGRTSGFVHTPALPGHVSPRRRGLTCPGGEGGIRTHVPGFPDHLISSQRRYDRFGTSP